MYAIFELGPARPADVGAFSASAGGPNSIDVARACGSIGACGSRVAEYPTRHLDPRSSGMGRAETSSCSHPRCRQWRVAGWCNNADRCPAHLVAIGVLTELPVGAAATQALFDGEILHSSRVAGAGDRGLAPGRVTVTVSVAGTAAWIEPGHTIDLWRVDTGNRVGDRVADSATVVAVEGDAVTVSVPSAQAERLAVAALSAIVAVRTG